MLRRLAPDAVAAARRPPFTRAEREAAEALVDAVSAGGEAALRACAERFGDRRPGEPLVIERPALAAAADRLASEDRAVLERVAARIRRFADAQRASLQPLDRAVEGGRAGQRWLPVTVAGCYAPGGRHPLPSSALMTVIAARAAGVADVTLATPRPGDIMLAAAQIAGADRVLAVGGAHAIAALAHGVAVPAADLVAGPGNAYVTAAKFLVSATCGIDMLAGPSELLVIADASAEPERVAADLLAQAEHDPLAQPMLVSLDAALLDRVDTALVRQLAGLPTAATARAALDQGFAVLAPTEAAAVALAERLAPEHLQLSVRAPDALAARLSRYGALFLGEASAEVLGDYGMGPNHTLPTGGTARYAAGLSVATFLACRTWLAADPADPAYGAVLADTRRLAEIEGLAAHAAAAALRSPS